MLIREKFSLSFYHCKSISDVSWKYDVIRDVYFSNDIKYLQNSVQNITDIFPTQKEYV